MVMGRVTNQRRRWIVNRSLQFPFIKALVFTLGFLGVILLAGVFVAMYVTVAMFQLQQDVVTVQLLRIVGWFVLIEFLVAAPLCVWLLVWLGIMWTHRIAGPLVRIDAALQQMAQGDLNVHLTLRKRDLLAELAQRVQALAQTMRRRSSRS